MAAASSAPAGPALSARTATTTVVLQVLARALSAAMAVAVTAVVTRAVGVATYADWATALSVVTLFGFAIDPGVSPVVVRRLVQAPETCPTLRSLALARVAVVVVCVALVVGIVSLLRGADAAPLALVLAAQLLPRAIVLNGGAVLQADHRLHRQAFIEVGCGALGLTGLLLLRAADAPVILLGLVAITMPVTLLSLFVAGQVRSSPSAARIVPGDDRTRLRSIGVEIAPLALALALVALYTRLQVIFVNVSESPRGIAEYLLAYSVVEQLLVVASIVAAALMPFFADRARERVLFGDELVHEVLVVFGVIGALVAGGIVLLAKPVMRLLGGPELAAAAGDLVLLSPMAVALFVAVSLSYTYAAAGEAGRYLRFNLAGLVLAVVLNLLLTLTYGAPAAARSTWIVEFTVVGLAILPIAQAGPSGRAAVVRLGLMAAAGVAAGEAVHAGLPPVAGATVLLLVAGVGAPAVRRLVASRLLRPAGAGS